MEGPRAELWLRVDICNVLRAIDHAGAVLERIPAHDAAVYRSGYRAALQAVALAFDVKLEEVQKCGSLSRQS